MKKTIGWWDFIVPLEREPYYACVMMIEQEDPPFKKVSETVTLSLSDVEANQDPKALSDLIAARLEASRLWLEEQINAPVG